MSRGIKKGASIPMMIVRGDMVENRKLFLGRWPQCLILISFFTSLSPIRNHQSLNILGMDERAKQICITKTHWAFGGWRGLSSQKCTHLSFDYGTNCDPRATVIQETESFLRYCPTYSQLWLDSREQMELLLLYQSPCYVDLLYLNCLTPYLGWYWSSWITI